jgi:hypothetical protein
VVLVEPVVVVVDDDPSDEVVVVWVPPSDVRVVVVVDVVVCARAGTIPITVPIIRAVGNFMRLSKLHGEWQIPLLHRTLIAGFQFRSDFS